METHQLGFAHLGSWMLEWVFMIYRNNRDLMCSASPNYIIANQL